MYWFDPKVCDTPEEEYTEVMNSPWYQRSEKGASTHLRSYLCPVLYTTT
jgi:hypothetical protein